MFVPYQNWIDIGSLGGLDKGFYCIKTIFDKTNRRYSTIFSISESVNSFLLDFAVVLLLLSVTKNTPAYILKISAIIDKLSKMFNLFDINGLFITL